MCLLIGLVGPGTYNSDPTKGQNRPPTRTGQNAPTSDRLAALQRKLEDLERVHNEEKKAVSTLSQHGYPGLTGLPSTISSRSV